MRKFKLQSPHLAHRHASSPAVQKLNGIMRAMQAAYKQELSSSYGLTFNSLMCLNNMPIKRYVDYLQRQGQLEEYMQVGCRSAVAPLLSSQDTQDCPSVHVLRVTSPLYVVLFYFSTTSSCMSS